MSKGELIASYLPDPPIWSEFLTPEGQITTPWKNWINLVGPAIGIGIIHGFLKNPINGQRYQEIGLLKAPDFTTTQRDMIDSPQDGVIIYNTDMPNPAFNFRVNGAWVTFTPIPA
jgi:hypothetical protein